MEWSVMELKPSHTTHLINFSFPPNWEVSNGMEHSNNKITTWSLFFIPSFSVHHSLYSFLHFLFQPALIFYCLFIIHLYHFYFATLHSNKLTRILLTKISIVISCYLWTQISSSFPKLIVMFLLFFPSYSCLMSFF